jgi:hypothetical protein
VYFEKLSYGSETLDMTFERLGEMFIGDSADTCVVKLPLVLMGGRADRSSVRRRVARTPIGASVYLSIFDEEKLLSP